MDLDLHTFIGLGGFPLVSAFVQLAKGSVPATWPAWTVTAMAFGFSVVWSALVAVALVLPVLNAALLGVIVWLAAMGFYGGAKAVLTK